jgi:putative transposase
MFQLFRLLIGILPRALRSRRELLLENLVLRQQLSVLKRRAHKARVSSLDKLFWVMVQRFWSGWKRSLILVSPETVVRWHRAGFGFYWTWLSHHRICLGRKRISTELRELIFKMVAENPTWGAPRIHGELQMLGFDISERTVSRWVQRAPRNPDKVDRWKAFLQNHREAIAAMDFFTVHTATFKMLYCFFILSHDHRRILHFNVTRNPTSHWVVQQLREAFPFEPSHKYLIFDRDAKFGPEVIAAVKAVGRAPKRTSFRSPWQNGTAER